MGLILLDLDGTLVEDAIVELENPDSAKGFTLGRRQHELYSEPTLKPHVYETLKRHADEGDRFAIVTNQGGVALGYHTQAEVYGRIARTAALLSMFWSRPFSVHVAWMMPKGYVPGFKGDDGRKPASDMLEAAMLASNPLLPEGDEPQPEPVLMVGDRDEDRDAAAAAGVDFATAGSFFGW
jgi:histidinol phosphatase-like enzyme